MRVHTRTHTETHTRTQWKVFDEDETSVYTPVGKSKPASVIRTQIRCCLPEQRARRRFEIGTVGYAKLTDLHGENRALPLPA